MTDLVKTLERFTVAADRIHQLAETVREILDHKDADAPGRTGNQRELVAKAWLYGHCAARGFSFTEIDFQGCLGSKLWHEALDIADLLLSPLVQQTNGISVHHD